MNKPESNESSERASKTVDAMRDELEMAWTIIANAGGGDWQKESAEWQEVAAKWRDRYHAAKGSVSHTSDE